MRSYSPLIISVFLLTVSSFASGKTDDGCYLENTKSGKEFGIYDALLYSEKPDLELAGFSPVNMLYAWNFVREAGPGNFKKPTAERLDRVVSKLARNRLSVIDIEHWPLSRSVSSVDVKKSIDNYTYVISELSARSPETVFGFYGVVPVRDFARAKSWRFTGGYREWQRDNSRVKPIADLVGATLPSLYTITSSVNDWKRRAQAQIDEARRLAPDVPVYPFLWPDYHPQGGRYPKDLALSGSYWRKQLEFLSSRADGVVIWGGKDQVWSESDAWWKETKDFIATNFTRKCEQQ